MGQTAQVKLELTSEAKLAALTEYSRRTAEATERTNALRGSMRELASMTKLGAVFGAAGLTVASLKQNFDEAINSAGAMATEIARSAGRVGTSAEAFQVLGNILKSAQGDAADLTVALSHLQDIVGEALRNPGGGAAKALAEVNLQAKDLSKLSPEAVLEKIAKALAAIVDPARRASVAQDLLGKGAVNIAPVLDRLASDGYAKLREEVSRTAGVMSNEMAKALDDAANRTENAGNRMAIALAPFQFKVAETKASISELFALITESPLSAKAGLIAGGAAVAAVGAATISAAGGIGSAEAWGLLAGMTMAKAAATTVPIWMSVGALIAAGFAGAAVIKGLEQSRLAQQQVRDEFLRAPLDRAKNLQWQLREARSPEMVDRIQQEAARRAREEAVKSATEQDGALKANLQEAARLYWSIAAAARQHGVEIVQANRLIDEQKAEQSEAAKTAADKAAREKDAADWVEKQGRALADATDERRRQLDLEKLDPAERLAELEQQKKETIDAANNFRGTASEQQRNEILTAAKLVDLDAELAKTSKESADANKRAADEKDREAKAAQRKAAADALRGFEGDVDRSVRSAHEQDARNQADFRLTEEEKRKLRIAALEDERDQLVTGARQLRGAAADLPAESQTDYIQGARRYEDRALDVSGQLAATQAGTPQTAMEGLDAGLTKIQDRWGTLAQQMQTDTERIGDAITGSLSGGMEQLLGTTDFWSQKLGTIAGPIMGAITQSIADMAAQFITSQIIVAGIKKMLGAQEAAENKKEVTQNATAAGFKSIAQLGPIFGPLAFAAAAAAIIGIAGGFFEGGFTGLGNPNDPAGIVHKGEFVIPHDVTNALGTDALSGLVESVRNPSQTFDVPAALSPRAVNFGPSPAAAASVAGTSSGKYLKLVMLRHDDHEGLAEQLNDPRASRALVKHLRSKRAELGIQL